jgi:hypothetical protein
MVPNAMGGGQASEAPKASKRPPASERPRSTGGREPSKVKGSVLAAFVEWYETRPGGRARMNAIHDKMSPADRLLVDPRAPSFGLLASEWYPSSLVHTILDGVSAGLDRVGQRALAREGCEVVVPKLVRGMYRVVFAGVATPTLYARFVPRLWKQLHTSGERSMTVTGSTAESVVTKWDGHHPMLCDVTLETMRELFVLMLKQEVVATRLSCVSEGASECRSALRW